MALFTWQGEFTSALREKRFRITHWPATALRMRFFAGFTSLVYLAMAVADHFALATAPAFYTMLSLRLVCFALGWANVVLSFSKRYLPLLSWTLAFYMLALGGSETVLAVMVQTPRDGQFLVTICLVLTYYMFLPPSLLSAMAGAVGASALYLVAVASLGQAPASQLVTFGVFFVLINVFGVYFLRLSNQAARVQFHSLREERLLNRRLRRETAERRKAQAQLQLLATTDDLTGLFNRRRFLDMCRHELLRFQRYGQPVSLLLLDVDHLKHINDTYGHDVGDELLQNLASRCSNQLRTTDMPGRLGGEEFGMLLPCTAVDDAVMVAQRIRKAVATKPLQANGLQLTVSVSIGVAEAITQVDTPQKLLQLAEKALDHAKASGGNQVRSVTQLPSHDWPENVTPLAG